MHDPKSYFAKWVAPRLRLNTARIGKIESLIEFCAAQYRFADQIVTLTDAARQDLIENFATPAAKVATMNSNAVITPEAAERVRCWDGETGREPDLIASVARLALRRTTGYSSMRWL